MIKSNTLAYLAALVDGEGYICIRKVQKKNYQLLMSIANCCPTPLKLAQKLFKGSLSLRKRSQDENSNRRDCWQYQVVAQQAKVFIKAIYPYMRIKQNQAKLALEFMTKDYWYNPQKQLRIRIKMQVFNKRGKNGYIFS